MIAGLWIGEGDDITDQRRTGSLCGNGIAGGGFLPACAGNEMLQDKRAAWAWLTRLPLIALITTIAAIAALSFGS